MGCEQFFGRRQQQDNRAGRSSFEPSRHETGMVSPPAGAFFPSFTIYDVLPDLPGEGGISTTYDTEMQWQNCIVVTCRSERQKCVVHSSPRGGALTRCIIPICTHWSQEDVKPNVILYRQRPFWVLLGESIQPALMHYMSSVTLWNFIWHQLHSWYTSTKQLSDLLTSQILSQF